MKRASAYNSLSHIVTLIVILLLLAIPCAHSESTNNSSDGFDRLIGEIEKDAKARDESLYRKPFDTTELSKLGQAKLQEYQYSFNGLTYNVFLYPNTDEELIQKIVSKHENEYFYSVEYKTISGVECVELTQFGADQNTVIICPNVSSRTMLMLENDIDIVDYGLPMYEEVCPNCNGKGVYNCTGCHGSGKHESCDGSGYRNCSYCRLNDGTPGKCPHCHGSGQRLTSTDRLKYCSICSGTGTCYKCNSLGHTNTKCSCENGICYFCDGKPTCATCKGTGTKKTKLY